MSKALAELAARRANLIEQCAQQRSLVRGCIAPLRRPLAIANGGIAILQYLRAHPIVLLGSGLVYTVYRLQSIRSWSKRAWLILGLFSKTRQFINQANDKLDIK